MPRHDRKDDRLESQARQQATQHRIGSGLHGSRQRQAPLWRLRRQLGDDQDQRGRQGVNSQRRGRMRPRRAHGDVPDRRRRAWRAGRRRGNFPRRHRSHDFLFRRFRQPPYLRERQRGQKRRDQRQAATVRASRGNVGSQRRRSRCRATAKFSSKARRASR